MLIRVTIALGLMGSTVSAPMVAQERSPTDYMAAIEGVQTSVGDDSLGMKTIDELMEQFGVPGVSIAVIWDFDVHWAKGYGIADVETGAPVDTETVFQAASISKPVTAMAVLEAVQDGLFTLDDDINDILKSWQLEGGAFTRDQTVTPRTLTSHTSGLGDAFGFPGYDPGDPLPTVVQILDGHELSNVGPVFMEREPWTAYEYSGGGVTVMQLALSDARGRPFQDIMRTGGTPWQSRCRAVMTHRPASKSPISQLPNTQAPGSPFTASAMLSKARFTSCLDSAMFIRICPSPPVP